jgi:hypothetical protein
MLMARIITIVALSTLALLSFGQAITLAWLSAFPSDDARLASLGFRFWTFVALGVVLGAADIYLMVCWVRQINREHRQDRGE